MKKKKYNIIAVGGLLTALLLSGCGGSAATATAKSNAVEWDSYAYEDTYAMDECSYEEPVYQENTVSTSAETGNKSVQIDEGFSVNVPVTVTDADIEAESSDTSETSRKLIRNVDLYVETCNFEQLVSGIEKRVAELEGYVENMSTGANGPDTYVDEAGLTRSMNDYANICIRIPADKLDEFLNDVETNSNVTSRSEYSDDVTLKFADVESHIKALKTEQERLIQLIASAQDVDTIVILESRLSEIRYQLESYESQVRIMQNQVDYSTVNLCITEVLRYTPPVEKSLSSMERMAIGFNESVYNIKSGLKELGVDFVINLPYIIASVLIACIILLLVLIPCSISKSNREKKEKVKKNEAQEQKIVNPSLSAVSEEEAEKKIDEMIENIKNEITEENKE